MNTNTMELNLDEMEMITGGDLWNRVKGAVAGAAIGCVGGTITGLIAAGPVGAAVGFVGGTVGGAVVGGIAGGEKVQEMLSYLRPGKKEKIRKLSCA